MCSLLTVVEVTVADQSPWQTRYREEPVGPQRPVKRYLRKDVVSSRVQVDCVQYGGPLRHIVRSARKSLGLGPDPLVEILKLAGTFSNHYLFASIAYAHPLLRVLLQKLWWGQSCCAGLGLWSARSSVI
jgi:hypothetical protein